MNIEKIKYILLITLIVMLPYHYMLVSVLAQNISWLKYWKEVLIFLLFLLDMIQRKGKYKINKLNIVCMLLAVILIVYTIISDNKISAISISRIYFLPLLLIPVVSNLKITSKKIKTIFKIFIINTIILSIWGIFQSVFLGDQFLIKIGYESYYNKYINKQRLQTAFYISGILDFQRLTSTFVSPNTCAIYLVIAFTLLLYLSKEMQLSKSIYYVGLSCIGIAILLTFSRSAWIILSIALIIYLIKILRESKRSLLYIISIILITILFVLIIDRFFLNSYMTNIGMHLIKNTFSFKDTSIIGHLDSLKKSTELFLNNIWGLGLGNNGPKAISRIGEEQVNLTESSYFLIAFDLGIIGLITYYSIYILIIIDNIKKVKLYKIKNLAIISIITFMYLVSYIFLPYVQEFELLVFYFIIISVQYNVNFLEEHREREKKT